MSRDCLLNKQPRQALAWIRQRDVCTDSNLVRLSTVRMAQRPQLLNTASCYPRLYRNAATGRAISASSLTQRRIVQRSVEEKAAGLILGVEHFDTARCASFEVEHLPTPWADAQTQRFVDRQLVVEDVGVFAYVLHLQGSPQVLAIHRQLSSTVVASWRNTPPRAERLYVDRMAEDSTPSPSRQRHKPAAVGRAGGSEGLINTPDILGMTEGEARATVRAAGLQLIITYRSAARRPTSGSSVSWPIRAQIPTAGTAQRVDDVVVASYDPLPGDGLAGSVVTCSPDPGPPPAAGGTFGHRHDDDAE